MPERSSNTPDGSDSVPGKNPHAVELGRRGGSKGGRARAASLTPEQRSAIARKAAAARWERRAADYVDTDDGRTTKRGRLKERMRQAFLAGAEEHSRQTAGRSLTAEEAQRVLKRYPGDLETDR